MNSRLASGTMIRITKVVCGVKPGFFVKKGLTWFDSKLELQVQHASPLNSKFKTDPIYINLYIPLLRLVFLLRKIRFLGRVSISIQGLSRQNTTCEVSNHSWHSSTVHFSCPVFHGFPCFCVTKVGLLPMLILSISTSDFKFPSPPNQGLATMETSLGSLAGTCT